MDLYDVMHTTFAARDFVDEPVPDDVIRRILDHARFAPVKRHGTPSIQRA